MVNKRGFFYQLMFLFWAVMLFHASCSHKAEKINEQLYSEATSPGLINYKNGDTLFPKGSSPHGKFVLRINQLMASRLDANGKLMSGDIPDGALIVKEVLGSSGLEYYTVMKKERKSRFAAEGWIWAEYKPGGSIYYDATRKGGACTSCHGGEGNQDFILTFALH